MPNVSVPLRRRIDHRAGIRQGLFTAMCGSEQRRYPPDCDNQFSRVVRGATNPQDKAGSIMKKQVYWLSSLLLLAGGATGAHAQDVWAYEVIFPNNEVRIMKQPPRDLTYPPPGMPMPIVYGTENRGVVLTPQQAAARRNAPQLVIMLIPAFLAERTVYSTNP